MEAFLFWARFPAIRSYSSLRCGVTAAIRRAECR